MKLKAMAACGVALGAVAAETVNLYKQVMGRGDRPTMPVTRLMTRENQEENALSDQWRAQYSRWAEQQEIERCTITSDRGDLLRGYYLPPAKESNVIVFGSHGYHADHTVDPHTFIKHYHDKGYGFFYCDHVGCGASSGKYVGFDHYESQDMLRWIDYLTARFGKDITVILHGVSMGAATVLQLAGKRRPDCVRLIISDCAYTSALDEFSHVVQSVGIAHPKPILWAFNELNKRLAGFDLKHTDVRGSVSQAQVPILFIHGGQDDFVPTRMVYELYNLCPPDKKEMKVFDNAKHAQSLMLNETEYLCLVDDFIDRRLKNGGEQLVKGVNGSGA